MPQFLINLCACLVAAMMTRSLTTYGGDMAVGAFGICNRLILFIVMVVIGLNQGMQPIAGYNFGAKRYDRVIEVLKLALIGGSLITLLGFTVGTFFSTPIVTLFAKDSPELIAMAAHALECLVMMFPIVGIQIVSTAFFQSIGYAGKSIFLSLTRQLIFLVPAILILPHVFSDPLEGLWHAAPVADGLASILAITLLTMQVKKFKANTSAMG
ncbi:MATE efflux family protein [gut metagenome]|uniref:MATE efflux family protein n=1 Tax=gut metagenome TaxID=749906 RepID=J9H876_9ZZZZ